MHAAPSVRYPVARSRAAGLFLAAAWGAGALVTLWWTWQASAPGWRQGAAALLVLAVGAFGWSAWRRSPCGSLAWDGARWSLAVASGTPAPGHLEPGADLQWLLLARWRPESGGAAWFWLERRQAPHAWDALRRAVYSRARTEAPPGVQSESQPPVSSP
jgi:toxin CptA